MREGGGRVATAHLRHLRPMPANTGALLRKYERVLVPEMNSGQLAHELRARYLVNVESYGEGAGPAADAVGDGEPDMAAPGLTKADFQSDQETRWCPGCGDYAVLAAVQAFFPELGIPPERIVFVSGIGCAGRFAYYMDTYGMHGIHGRGPALATGLAAAREDLSIWVVTGDGDALSIGGNHLIHALRRNVPVKILLFNNQIYGLTKGQASPTSELGKVTKSTPFGSIDAPFNPVSLALGAEATFVARTIDTDKHHLPTVLRAAAEHEGAALVEIYQNCPVFNDGAFDALRDKKQGAVNRIPLEHGQPIRFGVEGENGVVRDADGDAADRGGRRGRRGRARRARRAPRRSVAGVRALAAVVDAGRADADRHLPRRSRARSPGRDLTRELAPARAGADDASSTPRCTPGTRGPSPRPRQREVDRVPAGRAPGVGGGDGLRARAAGQGGAARRDRA